ncbi:unnamed protein product, partial [Iphiclides podalirius]
MGCETHLGLPFAVCQSFDCHDDPSFEPEEGPLTDLQFSWLGALQYIHVKEGTPHYFRVPRASLIARQFAISTAKDAAQVPDGYALGNVVFGEYERDENECKVSLEDIAEGHRCDPAVLLMPIADVLLHPEYKHFGIKTSVALLKLLTPVKSRYMLPACLPYKNFISRNGKEVNGLIIYVDFISEVPRDFIEEEKEVLYLHKIDTRQCLTDSKEVKTIRLPDNRYICTTGCDLQSGAPSVIHEHTGHWNIFALSEGSSPCPDPLRSRGPMPPSRHILLHPYVPWITTAISGKPVGSFSKDDPFGYIMPRAFTFPKRIRGWVGRWWLGGVRCYDRGDAAADIYRFYHEIFEIHPDTTSGAQLTYYLEINSAYSLYIVCVKVGMPFQIRNPMVWGINTLSVKLRIPLLTVKKMYRIVVEAWCNNGTAPMDEEADTDEVVDDSSSSDTDSDEFVGYDEELGKMGRPRGKKKEKGKDKGGKGKKEKEMPDKKEDSDLDDRFTPPDQRSNKTASKQKN